MRPVHGITFHEVNLPNASGEIVAALRRGDVQVAVAASDTAYLAYTSAVSPSTTPFESIRAIGVLDRAALLMLVGKHSRAQSIRDLAGARVNLGPRNSGLAHVAEYLFLANDLSLSALTPSYIDTSDAVKHLAADTLDAMFITASARNVNALNTALANGARILSIDADVVERLRLQYPFLRRAVIPSRQYPGYAQPIYSIGVDFLLVCRLDLDDSIVLAFLRSYYDEPTEALIPVDLGRAAATSIPLHPAAATFYRERELLR